MGIHEVSKRAAVGRLDLAVSVPVETKQVERLWNAADRTESPTAAAQIRISAARAFARAAGRTTPAARLPAEELAAFVRLEPAADRLLAQAAARWSFSARAVHRTLRVARTIADLSQSPATPLDAVAEALAYRHEVPAGTTAP